MKPQDGSESRASLRASIAGLGLVVAMAATALGGTDPAIVVNDNGSIVVMNPNGTSPTVVLSAVQGNGTMHPHFTPDGTQIVFNGNAGGGPGIYVVDRDGTDLRLVYPLVEQMLYGGPVVSPAPAPDGQVKIAFANVNLGPDDSDLFLINLNGTGLVNLTNTMNLDEWEPTWSPQGDKLCASVWSYDTLLYDSYVYELGLVSGAVAITRAFSLVKVPGSPLQISTSIYPDWARTQNKILLTVTDLGTGHDQWVVDLANLANPVNLTGDSARHESSGSWAPDDATIIYHFVGTRKTTGIYRMNANGSSRTKLSSVGRHPDRRRN